MQLIEEILVNLATGADPELREETINSIAAWKDAPFRPHLVARYRPTAYMFKAVMAYLDNLIAWGDALFRQDTGETINEATQLYVLAANLLGPAPAGGAAQGLAAPQTYAEPAGRPGRVRQRDARDRGGHPLRPGARAPPAVSDDAQLAALTQRGRRRCTSACRATTSCSATGTPSPTGCSRSATASTSRASSGSCRCSTRRSTRRCWPAPRRPGSTSARSSAGSTSRCRWSGSGSWLSQAVGDLPGGQVAGRPAAVGDREEGRRGARRPARPARSAIVLELAETVRYRHGRRRSRRREALEQSLANAVARYTHYERLLGKKDERHRRAGAGRAGHRRAGADCSFSAERAGGGDRATVDGRHRPDAPGEAAGHQLSPRGGRELTKLAEAQEQAGARLPTTAGRLPALGRHPDQFEVDVKPLGVGAGVSFGGSNLAGMSARRPASTGRSPSRLTYEAGQAARIGGYARREQDWAFQSNVAAGEITQTYKQLRAAQIREAMAEREWHNHQQQIRNAQEIERFLTDERTGKTSNAGVLRLAAPGGARPVRPLLPARLRRRPQGRTGAAARARRPGPHLPAATATWPAGRSCWPASGSTSTSSGWSWPTTSSTGASTS